MLAADALRSSVTGAFHINQEKNSTVSAKDHDADLIEAVTEKVLEIIMERGTLTPRTDADRAVRYRITSEVNRLSTANRRRRD